MRPSESGPKPLTIIYASLAAGVGLYAAVTLLVLDPPLMEPGEAGDPALWRLVWLGIAAAATLAAGYVKRRGTAAATPERRRTAALVVWALAEAQALLGITLYLLSADLLLLVLPLAVFAWLLVRHPPGSFGAVG